MLKMVSDLLTSFVESWALSSWSQHEGKLQWQVVDAIHTSQATLRKIRQNLGWAFAYNLVAIPVAAGALLPSAGIALTPSLAGASLNCHVQQQCHILQLTACGRRFCHSALPHRSWAANRAVLS